MLGSCNGSSNENTTTNNSEEKTKSDTGFSLQYKSNEHVDISMPIWHFCSSAKTMCSSA